ncbi:MAG: HAMP domain-containing histidine kinase [Ruminococcus sp.]|nr:HAMP domain-containing histidine kinase [Ruminococcus sp.]
MSQTLFQKRMADLSPIFAKSGRGVMITDKNFRIKWTNDAELGKGKVYNDCTGCVCIVADGVIPLFKTEIEIDDTPYYFLSRYREGDLLTCMKHEEVDRLYFSYAAKMRIKASNYLELPKMVTDQTEAKRLKDEIMSLNIKLLSNYANGIAFMKLQNLKYDFDPCCITTYLKLFLKNVKYLTEFSGYDFTYDVDELMFLSIDRTLLLSTIANLIINAIMYNKNPDAKTNFDSGMKRGCFYFTVSDNGQGIDEQTLKNSKKPCNITNGGEGLGLYLARQFTNALDGEFKLDTSSSGTEITITLPRRLTYNPTELWSPPHIPYPTLLEPEYLILAKGLETFEAGRFYSDDEEAMCGLKPMRL